MVGLDFDMVPGAPPGAPPGVPAYGPPCPTCGTPLPLGVDRCPRCGAVHGAHRQCEYCGARSEVVHKGGMIFVCAACGRPRIPMERAGVVKSGQERAFLMRAGEHRRDAAVSNVAGIVGITISAFMGLISLIWILAFGLGFFGGTGLGVALFVALMGAYGVGNAKKNERLANEQMREALMLVAMDVMRSRGPVTSKQLAEQLGIPEDVAEKILAVLPAKFRVETVVDERATDGLLRYRIAEDAMYQQPGMSEEEAEKAAFDAKLAAAMRAKGQG